VGHGPPIAHNAASGLSSLIAEETEAFARARESASLDGDATGRFGLWVGSYVRFELPSVRIHAAAFFLRDVASRPDSPEAGVAHRAAGVTCWFAGEYVEARDQRSRCSTRPRRRSRLSLRTRRRRRGNVVPSDRVTAAGKRQARDFPR
jgi:hypothetical protein